MNKSTSSLKRLLTIIVFDHTSLNMTFPILTLVFFDASSALFSPETSYAVRSLWYGLCIAIPHIVIIFAAPVLSSLSDYYGRHTILAVGTLGAFMFAITAGLGVFFGLLGFLIAGRVIQGLFSKTNPTAQAVIGDIAPPNKKILYMGYLQFSISVGACLGPIVGGYFAHRFLFSTFNFSLPYFIAAFFALISFLLTLFYFKETLPYQKKQREHRLSPSSILAVLKKKGVIHISLLLFLSQISWSLYYQFMPPVLKTQFHFSASQIGLFVGMIALWLALSTGICLKFATRYFSQRRLMLLSIFLVLIGLVLTIVAGLLSTTVNSLFWLAAIPTAVGDVIAYSCITALYSQSVAPNEQGKVMGLCFIIVSVAWAGTGLIGGVLTSISALLPILIAPVGVLLILLLQWLRPAKGSLIGV